METGQSHRSVLIMAEVKNFRVDELMEFYKSDLKLKKFLHIIENSQVYPVLYDPNRLMGSSDIDNWIREAKDSAISNWNDHIERPV
ncbi:hypothetical protein ACSBR2_001527 [Camellia fascicularis]